MSRPMWFVALLKKLHPPSVRFAAITKQPVVGTVVDRMLFEGDDLMVLPKNQVIAVEQTLDPPESVVLPSRVVEHFIDQARVHVVLDACICRQANGCSDYSHDLGCLMLGEAALQINPKLGRRVSADDAHAHLQRCQDAGLVHLVGRNKLDSVWLGARPGHRLMTICNCCPCCCLWRALPNLTPRIADKVTRMPGVELSVSDECDGCLTCADVCFAGALRVDGTAEISDECRGCGRCVEVCPRGAITLTVTDDGFVRRAIERLAPHVDLS